MIDLTLSDDEDVGRPSPKRPRLTFAAGGSSTPILIDVEDVPVQLPRPRPAAPPAGVKADTDLDPDQDLMVTAECGDVATRDYPHSRSQCAVHKFLGVPCSGNAAHCDKCYCYVCDCPASSCSKWGSGSDPQSHCHAHPGNKQWVELRTLTRKRQRSQPQQQQQQQTPASARPPGASGALNTGSTPLAGSSSLGSTPGTFTTPARGGRQTTLLDRLWSAPRPSVSAGTAAAAAGGCMGAPDSVEASAAPGTSGVAPPLATPMAPPKRLYGKLAGRLPPHWRELPHPSTLPRTVHMASLRLPVRARRCTIADLQARLCSTGYEYRAPAGTKNSASGRSLHENGMYSLTNLTGLLTEDQDKPFTKRRHLEMGCLRQQQGLREERQLALASELKRVLKLQVARDYKRQQLVTMGLPVSNDAVIQAVAKRLQEEEGLGDCSSEAYLVVGRKTDGRMRADPYDDMLASTTQQVWAFKVPCGTEPANPTTYAVLRLGYVYNSTIGLCNWLRCCAVAFPRHVRTPEEREAYIWEFLREQLQAAQGAGGKPIPQERPASLSFGHVGSSQAWVNGGTVTCHNYRVELCQASSKEVLLQKQAAYGWEPFLADPVEEASARPEHLAVVLAAAKAAKKELKAHAYLDNRLEEVVRELQTAASWAPSVVQLTCPDPATAPDVGILEVEVYVQKRYDGAGALAWPTTLFKAADTGVGCGGPLVGIMELLLLQGGGAGRQMLQELHTERQGLPTRMTIPQLHDKLLTGELPSAEQPPGLSVQLLPYQRQTLHFMQQQEDLPRGFADHFYIPLTMPCGTQYWYSPVWRHACLEPPATPKGGFLAEQMGMGKTVEALALLLSRPAAPEVVSGTLHPKSGKIMSRGTLVVCAVSLVGQWEAEVEAKLADENVRVYKYHGGSRTRNVHKLCEYDLVITTYGILSSDEGGRSRKGDDALGKIHWHRVVFDEGQTLKNPAMRQSRAAAALTADRRWSCSGTPVNTGIEDLVGQCGALNLAPIDDTATFKRLYKHALDNPSGGRLAELLVVLRKTLVRHTKEQKQGDRPLLALPSKSEEIVTVTLSPEEREVYLKVHRKVAAEWDVVRALPDNMISSRILPLLGLLTPLRRMCSGGTYTLQELGLDPQVLQQQDALRAAMMEVDPPGAAAAAVKAEAGAGEAAAGSSSLAAGSGGAAGAGGAHVYGEPKECPVCFELVEQPLVTPCGHLFCRECILACLADSGLCPMCRTPAEQAECKEWQPPAAPAAAAGAGAGPSRASTPAATPSSDLSDIDMEDQEGRITAAAAAAAAEAEAAAAAAVAAEAEAPAAAALPAAGSEPGQGVVTRRGALSGGPIRCDSKLQALMADLTAALAADASTKALVFGQYGGSMAALESMLTRGGVRYATIKGNMTQTKRSEAIKAFQGDPSIRVFLLSVRAGAVGITLTAARLVYLLEPCLNPSLEEQAVGRAWRLGQQHHVTVKRLVVQGSIEEHILEVRAARDAAAPAAAHGGGGSGAAEGAGASGSHADMGIEVANTRLHVAAAAGSVQADKQALRAAELAVLFKEPRLEGPPAAGAGAAAAALVAVVR